MKILRAKLNVIDWEGMYELIYLQSHFLRLICSTSNPEILADAHKRIFAVLGGQPTGGERPWTDVHDDTVEAMQAASEGIATFACQQGHRGRGGGGGGGKKGCDFCSNRRGNYRSVSVGLSHGQGQDVSILVRITH